MASGIAVDPALYAPPSGVPDTQPTSTRTQQLPFGDLTWENFERLILRLAASETSVERCVRFGTSGQDQAGIDIFARYSDLSYHCWQAKRHRKFSARKVKRAVDDFIDGSWATKCKRFSLAVQGSLSDTNVQLEIEKQAERLRASGIQFAAFGGDELTATLRDHPRIVDDFFGRAWVKAFLGEDAAARLGERLDGQQIARVRCQLRSIYEQQFHLIDPGSFATSFQEPRPPLDLLERLLAPDLLVRQRRERVLQGERQYRDGVDVSLVGRTETPEGGAQHVLHETVLKRVPMSDWVSAGDRFAFVGEAGSGKSTLLRCIALDLLTAQKHFPLLPEKWGDLLPLYVPFARWCREVAKDGPQVGFKEIVKRTLQPLLTADLVSLVDRAVEEGRILLLVDGLDEWSDEQPARTALNLLLTSVGAHNICAVVSARPRGLDKIGAIPSEWRTAELAPLSIDQQRQIASRWFDRYDVTEPPDQTIGPLGGGKTDRFMAELARDRALSALAEVPLLLVGLITLSLRGQVLPRNKIEAYGQLVELLLEQHPQARATASGETENRFKHAQDPEQRRAALAHLAYAVRAEARDAGYPLRDAQRLLRQFLASPSGFDLDPKEARLAANEILAVNAETQGILVEKAPGEIGFAHASFEEFLGAEYVASWPFAEVRKFVTTQAGNPRWRNVIANLLGTTYRRDEFASLVEAIKNPHDDPVGRKHRESLLTEVAFSSPNRAPAITRRLIERGFKEIEEGGWLASRRRALSSALNALADPTVGPVVAQRLRTWVPSRSAWRESLFGALGEWQKAPDLLECVWRGLHDERRGTQRAAAGTLARVFGGSKNVASRVLSELHKVEDISAAASMLEALQLGWPDLPESEALFREAASSLSVTLRVVGIAGLAQRGIADRSATSVLLDGLRFFSELDYSDRPLALQLLIRHWPDDPELIRSALEAGSRYRQPEAQWEHDDAAVYLLSCSTDNPDIRGWVKTELSEKYPFNMMMNHGDAWQLVARFVAADDEIRAAAISHFEDAETRALHARDIALLVAENPIEELRPGLIERSRNPETFDQYWAVLGLLRGWGFQDTSTREVLTEVAGWPNEQLINLVSLLPEIISDKRECRSRLLSISADCEVRKDLLAQGLVACGCDGTDQEAVKALLKPAERMGSAFAGTRTIFSHFAAHPQVHELARTSLRDVDADLPALAIGFEHDAEIREAILSVSAPLPLELRSQIADAAIADPKASAFGSILEDYDLEHEPDLKVRLSAGYYRALASREPSELTVRRLVQDMKVGGPDHEARRAAALTGLLNLGKVAVIKNEVDPWHQKPVKFATRTMLNPMPSLHEELCAHWRQLTDTFGAELESRIGERDEGSLAVILANGCSRSPEARDEFLARFEEKKFAISVGSLKAYARERPHSDRLLERCWELIEKPIDRNDRLEEQAEVVMLLREQFPQRRDVEARFRERFEKERTGDRALLLALYAPESLKSVAWSKTPLEIATEHRAWATATHMSAALDTPRDFISVVKAVVMRSSFTRWDMQPVANVAVLERVSREEELASLFEDWLQVGTEGTLVASAARYLAAAGQLSPKGRALGITALEKYIGAPIPLAVYDPIGARVRSASTCLMDALSDEAGQ